MSDAFYHVASVATEHFRQADFILSNNVHSICFPTGYKLEYLKDMSKINKWSTHIINKFGIVRALYYALDRHHICPCTVNDMNCTNCNFAELEWIDEACDDARGVRCHHASGASPGRLLLSSHRGLCRCGPCIGGSAWSAG